MAKRPQTPALDPATITKDDVAKLLDETSLILQLLGDNPFRIRAFSNAARAIESLTEDLRSMIESEELLEIDGIGKGIFGDIKDLFETGRMSVYDDARAQIPDGLLEILKIPGMGPKKVKAVHEKLGVETVAQLEKAAKDDMIAALPGFGKKSQERILANIENVKKYESRVRFNVAFEQAQDVLAAIEKHKDVKRALIGGSIRRRKETIGDIDILVSAKKSDAIMDLFTTLSDVKEVTARGETKSSVKLKSGVGADLRVVADAEFAFASHYFTGSKAHNTKVRGIAKKLGLRLNEYGLFDENGKSEPCKDEKALFARLGLDYIDPELREDNGEIEAAQDHTLPKLVTEKDIRGVFHCHTTYSDGHSTLEEMVNEAREMGFAFFGVADHSQSAVYGGGLKPDEVARQREEIDALNEKLDGFTVFQGIESEILADGSLDYTDEILSSFDYIVAAVHSQFGLTEKEMTDRMIKAVENPHTTMVAHPTGRLLLSRDGYKVDLQRLIDACAVNGVIIEINAHPNRLDLDWRHLKYAKEAGVLIAINPDSHHTSGIADYKYGVGIARKGWLEKKNVVNTFTTAKIKKLFASRGKKA